MASGHNHPSGTAPDGPLYLKESPGSASLSTVRLLVWRVAVGCRRQTGVPSRSQEQCVCFIKSCMLSLVALMVKNLPAMQETWVRSLLWEKSPGEGNGYPLQYSHLGNPLNREAWWPTVHGLAKSQT